MNSIQALVERLEDFSLCPLSLGRTPRERWQIFWRLTKNVRVRLGLAKYHPDAVYELPTRYGTLFLRDNFGDVTNIPDLFFRNEYRIDSLENDGVIMDIGANVGLFAAHAAFRNPDKKIYCFEPLAFNAKMAQMNCPTAVVNQIGIGRVYDTVKLQVDNHGIMASNISLPWTTHEETFEIMPLDEFVQKHEIDQVAFMKIDTEGMEVDVLTGGERILRQTHQVAMETHSLELHRESIGHLRDAGLMIEAEAFSDRTGMVFASRKQSG